MLRELERINCLAPKVSGNGGDCVREPRPDRIVLAGIGPRQNKAGKDGAGDNFPTAVKTLPARRGGGFF